MTTAPAYDNSVRIGYARVSTRAQDHQAQFDALADAVEQHLDTGALARIIEDGPAPGRPVVRPALGPA